MKRSTIVALTLLFILTLTLIHSAKTRATQSGPSKRAPKTRENFDLRINHQKSLDAPPQTDAAITSPSQPAGRDVTSRDARLRRERPGTRIHWSSLSTTPSRIWSFSETVTAPRQGDAETIARRFLKDNSDLFRLGDDQVDALRVAHRYRTEHNGLTHVTLGQQVNGIEIFQAEYVIHVGADGAIRAASGELIPDVSTRVNATTPRLTAESALQIALREVDQDWTAPLRLRRQPAGSDQRQEFDRAAGFGNHVPARLAYFPLAYDEVRLAWHFIITMRDTPDMYFVMIDADRGSLLFLHNLTCYDENPLKPHGQVYTKESPRPNLPRASLNPPETPREDLPFRAEAYNGAAIFPPSDPHYDWWAGAKADNLVSNNTTTYLDRDTTPNQPDLPRLEAADGNFGFPVDLTQQPTTENNQKAAQVNLFYWINRYHDILYSFGFNEAARNFQTDNFNLDGAGADAIRGEAQDGSGTNNANFATPPDGGAGRVQMYLFTNTDPQRDGDFDQGVIIHELTHGLSNRLIGNATGLASTHGGGMGEGWSDWFAIALLARESDDLNGEYALGQYVVNNFRRGIRRFPYSTSQSVFPLTFKDIRLNTEVHAVGEIWCNALLEVRAALIQKYGFKEGQQQAIQLVVDGMKLTPVQPTFVDARNAILLADRVNNQSANQCLLWQAFTKRGLGFNAEALGPSDGAPVESLATAFFCSDTGILAIDKNNYLPGEQMRITLGDRNATGAAAVQVSSSATGDTETLTLTLAQSGLSAGSFAGSLRTASGRAIPNDGVLQGSADREDEIAVVYNDPNNGAGAPARIKATAVFSREKTVFEDRIEQGNQGWIATGSWAITGERKASGGRSWTDSPGASYANSANSTLTSPLFDFTNLSDVNLNFAHLHDLEARYDYGLVEYSNDDGASWTRAAAFSGRISGFTQVRLDLRALDGQRRSRVRFRLFSDGATAADGWWIDDFRLTARSANTAIIPPGSTPAPVIASVSPAFGPPAGNSTVIINGAGFTEDETTTVTFDGLPVKSFRVMGSGSIEAVTPAHAPGQVMVRVLDRNGAVGFQNGFTYHTTGSGGAMPAITTLFPNAGSTRGGTAVTVIGADFTPETEITFGPQKAVATFINANTLRVASPAATNTGAVEVAAANGASRASLANGFNYVATSPPAVQLLNLNGGETLFARSVVNINWRSSDNRAIARHRIALIRGASAGVIAADIPGSDQSYAWIVPTNLPSPSPARIRVIAVDDEGAETEVQSSGDFTIVQRWETQPQLPAGVQRLQVASDGKFLYSFGGRLAGSSAATIAISQRLDPSAAQPAWSSANVAPMPTGLNGGEAVFLKGRVYIPGGFNASAAQSTQHFAYDVASNAWATLDSTPAGAILYALAADETRGVYYLTGGLPENGLLANVRSFDPGAGAWSDLPSMTTARYSHEAAMIEGRLYVVGGAGGSGVLAGGEVFDFSARQWTPIAPLNRPRSGAVNFLGKDAAGNPLWFVTGGQDGGGAFPGTEVYDVRNNRWIDLDDSFAMNTRRMLLGGAVAGDYFYAVGGATTVAALRNTERTRINNLSLVPLNQPPVIAVPAAQVAVAGVELKFTVSSNDLGNDLGSGAPIRLAATGLPAGANFTTENAGNNSTRGIFRWTPAAADTGQTFNVTFTASDAQLSDAKTVVIRVVNAGPLAAVNSADFRGGPLAADSIASAFGANLAVRTEAALELPLPVELAGTSVTVNGIPAPLFFVSPAQINFAVPSSMGTGETGETGAATIVVGNPAGSFSVGTVRIVPSAPALFSADATGKGDAAAVATPDGVMFQPPPFDVTVAGKPNILLLFATGVRRAAAANPNDENGVAESVAITIGGQNASVLYAGAQASIAGLDQINVEIPRSLAGQGQRSVEVVVTVNGITANRLTIRIK